MTASRKHMTRFGLVLGVPALLLGCSAAAAATLDQEACARLKTELLQLELAGTRTNIAKGPDWAKVNLDADKLLQIKRLMEVEEQLLFRCQGKPLVVLPEGAEAEAAPAPAGKDGAGPAKAATPMKATKEPQPPGKAKAMQPAAGKAAPAVKAPPKAAGADKTAPAAAPPAAQPKPKPKVKPKVDDAYRPSPASPAAGAGAAKP
jgi:hypothetical protein